VGLFRRKETLNEQLLREAGLDDAGHVLADVPPVSEPPAEPGSRPGPPESSDAGPFPVRDANLGHRPRSGSSDTTVTVRATLPGARITFATLPNGDIIVDEENGDGDIAPLAEAVEQHVNPPYRATAARQDGDLWAVGARQIQVAEFEFAEGDAIVLSVNDGAAEVLVDGEPSRAQVPELEPLGEREGPNYCVEADRIDGNVWEVRAFAF
jgi:hypothetical protein